MGMAINNPVIVTALYDIGRDKWEKFTQSYGGYIHWMERTLSLDSNLVIYTQQKFKDEIESYRRKYDVNLEKTIIVIQELEELEGYKLYNQKLNDLGIQTIVIAEYLENEALGKLEWIKLIAAFYEKEKIAEDYFDKIKFEYQNRLLSIKDTTFVL